MSLFHRHTWGQWSEAISTSTTHYPVQNRACQTCGKAQARKVVPR